MFGQSNSDSLPAYIKPNNQNITVTPTVTQQVFTADQDHTGLGTVTVNAVTSSIDQNITTENIKKDVTILGVTGSYEGSGGGDVITAINNTGANISVGDKVWICKDTGNADLLLRTFAHADQYSYTGFAKTSGADGASISVEIVFPDEITITLSTTTDDAYLSVR